MSGLTKIVRGGFPAGIADELGEKSEGAITWYKAFLGAVVIPQATASAFLIEIGELLIGIAMVAVAATGLVRSKRLSIGGQTTALITLAIANLAGIFMNVSFHLANGSPHPWLIPKSGFDEGVDLDSLMPAIQLVLIGVSIGLLWRLRRLTTGATTDDVPASHDG